MGAVLTEHRAETPLAARIGPVDDGIVIDWLGQAGFLLRTGSYRVLIDPYLSDTLAEKYRDSATPHERLMPPPVTLEDLGPVDLVLVTHQHTDHMDPGTLAPLAVHNPGLRFVVPRASRDEARRRIGVASDRLILLDAGEAVVPLPGLRIAAIRAAHETLERDLDGCHRFLGYALIVGGAQGPIEGSGLPHAEEPPPTTSRSAHRPASVDTPAARALSAGFSHALRAREAQAGSAPDEGGGSIDRAEGAMTVVHSGDTVPFEGQAAELAAFRPDLLLLPVNGRSPELAARNIAGNLTLDEAVALTAAVGAPAMVAHHHGMFAFNTLPLKVIEAKSADPALPIRLIPASTGLELRLRPA